MGEGMSVRLHAEMSPVYRQPLGVGFLGARGVSGRNRFSTYDPGVLPG